ncbi:SDR family oxidoreductase [Streptomyces griseoincarnatus]
MTRYAGRRAVIVGQATGIGLAVAKRLVEGGAAVLLTAVTVREREHAGAELGSAARVVAPDAVESVLGPAGGVDLVFADAVPTARPLLPHLADGGAVVLTAPAPSLAAVRLLAAELVPRGIRVNAVAPSCIEAPAGSAEPLPPLGRFGSAEEVARAALFLATDATFTTGARLPVDGGLGHP